MKAENKSYPLIFDPSCGKGEFLIESANKLAANNCSSVLTRLWAADFSQLNLLLTKKDWKIGPKITIKWLLTFQT